MNLPNRITLIRIALVPVFLVFACPVPAEFVDLFARWGWEAPLVGFSAWATMGGGWWVGGFVFCVAFFTDFLDGFIARRRGLVTDLGKFLDPLADKLLVCSAFIALTARGEVMAWATVIVVCREFVVTGLRLVAVNKGVVLAAGPAGKLKTVFQGAAIIFYLFQNFGIEPLFTLHARGILLLIAVLLTVFSGIDYIMRNRSVLHG